MRVDYYSYIESTEWRKKADAAKRRAGYRCQVCNRSSKQVQLNAHHRTYERLGHERPDDITVLCRRCHELYHKHIEGADDDDDEDHYDIDITPTRGPYHSLRPYNATSWASGATSRKSSSDAKWGWGAAAFFIVVAWLFIRAQSNSPQASERVRLYDAVTVQTVGVKPPVYTGPSFRCPVQNELETGSSVRIYAWAVSEGETWYRAGDGRWITGDSVATADEGDAQRTRRYITLPDCWGTPTPTRRPTRAPVTPTPETQQNSPREQFRK